MVRLTPQATYTWGGLGNTTAALPTGNPNDAALTAQEAWMSWTASDMVSLYVGRQMLSYGRGLIIG
ncbi:MAG: hypothetical protein JWQ35_2164, partial [Bacteriovoracaceae bacterium]|nr:hypothetical protein [Bacteriovoracaceae bacterium]